MTGTAACSHDELTILHWKQRAEKAEALLRTSRAALEKADGKLIALRDARQQWIDRIETNNPYNSKPKAGYWEAVSDLLIGDPVLGVLAETEVTDA